MPSPWTPKPIRELCEGLYDGPHATPKPAVDGPVFLGIKNITEDGKLDLTTVRHIADDDFEAWTRRVLPQAGDIVFVYEATLNRYAIVPPGFRGCLGRRLALIRPDRSKVDGRFLFYYFFTDEWRRVVAVNTLLGATVDRIRTLRELLVTLVRANTNLRATRNVLLPRLLSGQLRLANIEDNPELATASGSVQEDDIQA